jgi:uncharacterized lipoprotein (TIGR02269 family)
MSKLLLRWTWLWLLGALVACAAAQPAGGQDADAGDEGEPVSFEEACADEGSLLALCSGTQCGVFPCREVMARLPEGRVVRTWAEVEPLAEVGVGVQRYWGSAPEWPWDTRPVFIIPWDHKPPLLPSQQLMLAEQAAERNRPHEKHHVFPQAFGWWFSRQGINIHEYVIPLEVTKHRSIHRGERGGPWNAAWEEFIRAHPTPPSKAEIFRYAGQLCYQFELFGPVLPYWKQPPPLPAGY